MARVCFLLLAAGAAWAWQYDPKQPLTRETVLLGRIRHVVSENLAHLPNFTCVQTIERSQRAPNTKKYQLLDNVRLEVALVEGKELYAWPGASKFEERDVRELVGGGAIGTGDFALHAKVIYLSGRAKFEYAGVEEIQGKMAHKFRYGVPMEDSGYMMRIGKAEGLVGYHGHVWNDTGSLEMVRLDITVDQVPPHVPLKEGRTRIDYAPVQIGGTPYTLPASVEMALVDLSGGENRNRAVFAGCRQYTGESTLIFEEPAPDARPKEAAVTVTLPEGLSVSMRLTKTLDLSKAAMGDPVVFEVTRDAAKGGTVWLPKGARVELRLDQVACRDFPTGHCFAALAPGRFTHDNKQGQFAGRLVTPDLVRSLEMTMRNARPELRTLPLELGQAAPGSEFVLVNGKRGKLPSGYSTTWRTLEARSDKQP